MLAANGPSARGWYLRWVVYTSVISRVLWSYLCRSSCSIAGAARCTSTDPLVAVLCFVRCLRCLVKHLQAPAGSEGHEGNGVIRCAARLGLCASTSLGLLQCHACCVIPIYPCCCLAVAVAALEAWILVVWWCRFDEAIAQGHHHSGAGRAVWCAGHLAVLRTFVGPGGKVADMHTEHFFTGAGPCMSCQAMAQARRAKSHGGALQTGPGQQTTLVLLRHGTCASSDWWGCRIADGVQAVFLACMSPHDISKKAVCQFPSCGISGWLLPWLRQHQVLFPSMHARCCRGRSRSHFAVTSLFALHVVCSLGDSHGPRHGRDCSGVAAAVPGCDTQCPCTRGNCT